MSRLVRFARSYATSGAKYPRPKPGTAERPAYHAPDPLLHATPTAVTDAPDLTFIHRPPPTAPSPFSLTTNPVSPLLKPRSQVQVAADTQPLPPPLRPPTEKTALPRASDDTLAEIKRLRREHPQQFTRGKLAKKFGVTPGFVALVAALPKTDRKLAVQKRENEHAKARAKWSEKHSIVKAIRAKRRTLW